MNGGDDLILFEVAYRFDVTIDSTDVVKVTVPTVYSGYFGVSYDTPNGNRPAGYENQIVVFAGGPSVPAGALPVGSAPAQDAGSAFVVPTTGQFSAQPYVVAYSVGPFTTAGGTGSYPNVAATAYLPGGVGGSQPIQLTKPALGIQAAQSGLISWTYSFPLGTNPQLNNAWIGLWDGTLSPYAFAPAFWAPVLGPQCTGLSPMLVRLSGNAQYVGALFTSGFNDDPSQLKRTAIAAVIAFTTGPPIPI
ncbi:MAG TPA: hypothetical protein VGN14_06625 [Candidatus Elarobacter sp.]